MLLFAILRNLCLFGTFYFLRCDGFLHRVKREITILPSSYPNGDFSSPVNPEVIPIDDDDEEDWIPDRERARKRRDESRQFAERIRSEKAPQSSTRETKEHRERPSAYTEEEERVISAMGGRTMDPARKREPGYLGDSTLQEICTDYSVPICYLADVLCMWGILPPINVHDRLGDLVTGEQAFSILEAINTLDVAALQDRYSNTNLLQLCDEWDIDLQKALEMAMKEGWSLPFGVQTFLRVEQEEELLRVLGDTSVDESY